VSRKHKHRAMNRPVSRRYMEKQLAALRQDLTSTIVHATAREAFRLFPIPDERIERAVGGRS
jgi:hypothetical protein